MIFTECYTKQSTPVGILGITADAPRPMQNILGGHLAAVGKPRGVVTTLDLLDPTAKERILEAARSLVEQGARSLALACTGMSTTGVAPYLKAELNIPVVDPVLASGLMALCAVSS
ncbi:MAG: aspartate/glutamate racemase family protein [Bacillota bacterium]